MTWTDAGLLPWMVALPMAAWLPPRAWRNWALSSVGLAFLAFSSPSGLLLLAALGLAGWTCARMTRHRAWPVVLLIILVAGTLACFKWGSCLGDDRDGGIAPLGLAFYSLRILHYGIEAYKGALPAQGTGAYVRYLTFFPTVIAGPINRFPGFQRDERRRRWDSGQFSLGMERILYGYAKIVILANFLVEQKFGGWLALKDGLPAWGSAYLGCLQYGMNLYFQFAGYSDVAIGLALLLGFRVEENFNWPFLARNLGDFWRRWHITLSEWCRDYVFFPVASATRNPYLGVVASMLVLGLWHEISLRYTVWGLCHGLGIALWQGWRRYRPQLALTAPQPFRAVLAILSWMVTMNFVVLSFAITKAPDLQQAYGTITTILSFSGN
jgi:D-alanyl-lipoteichoic acid acyltransferase DltB (MBOAT superfamily)